MKIDRRDVIKAVIAAGACSGAIASPGGAETAAASLAKPFSPAAGPRSRLLFVNDLAGDLDGLYALVHAILSPTSELRGIVATGTSNPGESAAKAVDLAEDVLELMNRTGKVKIHAGAARKMAQLNMPVRSPGTQAIIDEARRTDTDLPLFVAVGGGLTEVASALLLEPSIADRFTLVWIGGDSYPEGGTGEYNFNIDRLAAQYVFNQSAVPIWQVPRSAYATCLVSASELQAFVAPHGRIGAWLYQKVVDAPAQYRNILNMGETWTMGDNPLVLLTSLADWPPSAQARPFRYERHGSSASEEVIAPALNSDGTFTVRNEGRKIRIFKSIDNRMMFNDLFAKLRIHYPAAG
ncbi:Twin-arginine translocation pathway signal precursor [Sphingomonas paucimobilis]|nr:Twin-arginine translocation pathway signal precursor [Sphingomonas paucimobilis]